MEEEMLLEEVGYVSLEERIRKILEEMERGGKILPPRVRFLFFQFECPLCKKRVKRLDRSTVTPSGGVRVCQYFQCPRCGWRWASAR